MRIRIVPTSGYFTTVKTDFKNCLDPQDTLPNPIFRAPCARPCAAPCTGRWCSDSFSVLSGLSPPGLGSIQIHPVHLDAPTAGPGSRTDSEIPGGGGDIAGTGIKCGSSPERGPPAAHPARLRPRGRLSPAFQGVEPTPWGVATTHLNPVRMRTCYLCI